MIAGGLGSKFENLFEVPATSRRPEQMAYCKWWQATQPTSALSIRSRFRRWRRRRLLHHVLESA